MRWLSSDRKIRHARHLHLLRLHAAAAPQSPAIILTDRFITFEMIWLGVNSVQAAIAQKSLDPNRPVAIFRRQPRTSPDRVAGAHEERFHHRIDSLRTPRYPGLDRFFRRCSPTSDCRSVRAWRLISWMSRVHLAGSGFEAPFPRQPRRAHRFHFGVHGTTQSHRGVRGRVAKAPPVAMAGGRGRGTSARTLALYSFSALPFDLLRVLLSGNSLVFSPLDVAINTMLTTRSTRFFALCPRRALCLKCRRATGFRCGFRCSPSAGRRPVAAGCGRDPKDFPV